MSPPDPIDLTVCCAANDESVLAGNLARSPMIQRDGVPLIVERGHRSAGAAYNAALARTSSDVIVFAHQDVYFPSDWSNRLCTAVRTLTAAGSKWGVLGVWGIQADRRLAGRVWCSGGGVEHAAPVAAPVEVASIDEIVIVLNRRAGLDFDENLPGFHLYATDLIQGARRSGLKAYVFDGPVIHNSRCNPQPLDRRFWAAYRYTQRKWWTDLPIQTCTVPVTRTGWPLLRQWARNEFSRVRGRVVARPPHPDPTSIAVRLGYEPAELQHPLVLT